MESEPLKFSPKKKKHGRVDDCDCLRIQAMPYKLSQVGFSGKQTLKWRLE